MMPNRQSKSVLALVFLVLVTACGSGQQDSLVAEATHTLPPATSSPTAVPATHTPTSPPTPTEIPPAGPILEQLEGLPIDAFFNEAWRQLQLRDPDVLIGNGFGDLYGVAPAGHFTDLSGEYLDETQQLERGVLDLLTAYDRESLSPDQAISYDALQWYLETRVGGQEYAANKFVVNPVWGLQNWPTDFLKEHPLETRHDVDNYIARLASLDVWVDQVIEILDSSEQAGAIPPRFVLEDTIRMVDAILQIRGTLPPDADRMEVYLDLSTRIRQVRELSSAERTERLQAALNAIEQAFIPAMQRLSARLLDLASIAEEDPNQWRLPGGEAYYAYLLAYHTGTNLGADEVHALALAEVARLQDEIQEAAVDLGYPASLSVQELNQILSEEQEAITGRALLREYERILAEADQAAETFFDLRASAGVEVRSNPDPNSPPAFYEAPEPWTEGPGVMPVNLDFSPLLVNYNEHVLVHHETIPGHHTQIALAQELDVPLFRSYYAVNPYLQNYEFLAYVEGWALYAEKLAWEMGLYDDDPFANLGRLRLRLLRFVRVVVDTGIHARGWTLDEAADYLERVTGSPQSYSALSRYIANPGYPCSYGVAALKLEEFRQRAMDRLGDAFDIREFHNVILGNGVIPIGVLERLVDEWIEAKLLE